MGSSDFDGGAFPAMLPRCQRYDQMRRHVKCFTRRRFVLSSITEGHNRWPQVDVHLALPFCPLKVYTVLHLLLSGGRAGRSKMGALRRTRGRNLD